MGEKGARIGAVAAQAGVNVQTLRYYERRGLLPPPARTASGYRHYSPDTAQIVRFIKRAQDLGFTLTEIQELLRLRTASASKRERVLKLATAKIATIDEKILRLRAVRGSLAKLVESCACRDSALKCSILESLGGET